jgi:serine/threonine-protein kinase
MQIIGNLGPNGTPTPTPAAQFTLPDFTDRPVAAARRLAEERGLVVEIAPDRVPSEEIEAGNVVSTDPPPGTSVSEGETVTFTVSSGEDTVPVPNLIGQTEDQAVATLSAAGLNLGQVDSEFSDAQPQGRVIRSTPGAGVDWPRGDQVDIVLSRGPAPTPTPEPPTPTPQPATPTPAPPTPAPATPTPAPT